MDSTANPWHRLADNTPILVGCAALSRRERDPAAAAEPISLLIEALALAEKVAGAAVFGVSNRAGHSAARREAIELAQATRV